MRGPLVLLVFSNPLVADMPEHVWFVYVLMALVLALWVVAFLVFVEMSGILIP